MKLTKAWLLIVVVSLGLSSCMKEIEDVVVQEPKTTLEEVVVSSDFNFETFKDLDILLTGYTSGLVEVLSPNGDVYQKVYLKKWEQYEMVVTIPTYEKAIQLRFQGKTIYIDIDSDTIIWNFVK